MHPVNWEWSGAEESATADLFKLGDFTLHSGDKTPWKIDCDALSDESISTLAHMIVEIVQPFKLAIGVPRGGMRLAAAVQAFAIDDDSLECLIVDDVLTTGNSMEEMRSKHPLIRGGPAKGIVIFARGPCPSWVTALFTYIGAK